MFNVTDFEAVKQGKMADVYFTRTEEILTAKGMNPFVKAEVMCKGLPGNWDWAVLAGLDEVKSLADALDLNVTSMPEGTIFRPYEPVMVIEGNYLDFGHLETAFLGLLCQASGVSTMAARCRQAAGEKTLFSFGSRRMHPVIAPMLERSAYIGGCDGVSVGLGAALVGQEPVGTMPHALILLIGDTVEATLAFDEIIDKKVRRISLVDTFGDEKFEALRVAEAMGDRLWGIRLDTPGSRRGDFLQIIKEVRWELDLAGFSRVKITVSGGLNEKTVAELSAHVDAFGVGTAISNAPVVDFSMDLVEIEGKAVGKRGKRSGAKSVYRCSRCRLDTVVPDTTIPGLCECGGRLKSMLKPLAETTALPKEIRNLVLSQLPFFEI